MNGATYDLAVGGDIILVCIDDNELRQRVTRILRNEWPVRTACDGRAAGESLDGAVSVVVFDLSTDGIEIDRTLDRRDEDGLAFETAAIVEGTQDPADQRLDDYIYRPVSATALHDTVERLHRRVEYDRLLGQYYAVASDYADAAGGPEQNPTELARLKERLFTMRRRLDKIADGLDDVDAFDAALGDRDDNDFSQSE